MQEQIIQSGFLQLNRNGKTIPATYCLLKADVLLLKKDLSYLSPSELCFLNKLETDHRILSYLGGRYACKVALSLLTGETCFSLLSIDRGVFEYPVVSYSHSKNCQVSLSHCRNFIVALAFFESHPLSIDIEIIDIEKKATLQDVISDQELNVFVQEEKSDITKLTLLWTIKEACSKILRTGLMTNFRLYEIETIDSQEKLWTSYFQHFPQYKALSLLEGNFALTVVLPRKTLVSIEDFSLAFGKIIQSKE